MVARVGEKVDSQKPTPSVEIIFLALSWVSKNTWKHTFCDGRSFVQCDHLVKGLVTLKTYPENQQLFV